MACQKGIVTFKGFLGDSLRLGITRGDVLAAVLHNSFSKETFMISVRHALLPIVVK